MAGLTCECAGPAGFTNLGVGYDNQWWVHAECGKPTWPWLQAQGDDMLNFFRGGPLDGTAYTTSALLDTTNAEHIKFVAQLLEYNWTPEVVVSQKTGASARVWVHHSITPEQPAPAVPSASAAGGSAVPAPASQEGTDMAAKKKADTAVATTSDLEERRKAGGFSRNQIAEASGLTVSKVYRIEKGGARTTEDETAAYTNGLVALEAANAS